ncbi:MAG TPA: bifunctional UDP-N-acetylglucosamine diphosphorylase/glucosamine-1-phosphate N-acetyltransferase GlmU [Thermosynergistes sp.]|nr:bifunctional UDP-N-acetylglucosamine diphosphorylase/glucosamine-1-phosphate N-acetyltransferase GlmU [Thermosynergistes sp.]HPZ75866.1 bifunctional UDP-N-acetylglucosamine diphosphorylase/glucosamine-1-phosphate N-acetyltransferase GlmU [Thermosynergistes sp.]HQE20759.1 bifunctional UDP-N-acetylglucosamine diphosphorylase/glucosamine-1-phosphate N-acetyltransferase GlmU [Thermosynergistes sp.]
MGRVGALVLAAGKGTRMKGSFSKVMLPVLGEPMIYYPLRALSEAGIKDIAVVVGWGGEAVESYLASRWPDVAVLWQREQLGTGHALMVAEPWWASLDELLVLPGDVPLVGADVLEALSRRHMDEMTEATFLTMTLDDPSGYGRVIQVDGRVRIVEDKDASQAERSIQEVNSGIYAFNAAPLADLIHRLNNDNAQKEYYLTDVLRLLSADGKRVAVLNWPDPEELAGVNDPVQLAQAAAMLRDRLLYRWMKEFGLKCLDPNSVWIGPEVSFEEDVWIDPWVELLGKTSVGSGSRIASFTIIRNSKLGSGVQVRGHVVLEDSVVGDGATIGPFAHLRNGAEVGEGAHVGKFVEIKNSTVGQNSKVPHLSYIGDALIGKETNIGAGTITCNFDGRRKHQTHIGDRCFVGSDTMLVAPVSLGDDSYTGAGSVITRDVPEGALAIARARQRNVEGWAKKRKEEER